MLPVEPHNCNSVNHHHLKEICWIYYWNNVSIFYFLWQGKQWLVQREAQESCEVHTHQVQHMISAYFGHIEGFSFWIFCR
jgi:hypothetical protein